MGVLATRTIGGATTMRGAVAAAGGDLGAARAAMLRAMGEAALPRGSRVAFAAPCAVSGLAADDDRTARALVREPLDAVPWIVDFGGDVGEVVLARPTWALVLSTAERAYDDRDHAGPYLSGLDRLSERSRRTGLPHLAAEFAASAPRVR